MPGVTNVRPGVSNAEETGVALINRQWCIVGRPEGLAAASDFRWHEAPVPALGPGQALVRNLYLSLDPTNRLWMWEQDTYLPAQALGQVMRGIAIGRVEASDNPKLPVGCHVSGLLGWQDYCVLEPGAPVNRLPDDPSIPLTLYFGLLGHIGTPAYFGVVEVGAAKAGETLLVSGAAGAVGSIAGQVGRNLGCRVVGIAGSDEKCAWLRDTLGFDAAINYRTDVLPAALDRHCPDGIDVFFDNVGGPLLETVLDRMRVHGRIALCGAISQYNRPGVAAAEPGPRNLFLMVSKRLRMGGFLSSDYAPRAREAADALLRWHREGRMQYRLHEVAGLEQAPAALNMLFDGRNQGKLVVKIA